MQLKDQYCTREQALELKKLGVINKCTRTEKDGDATYEVPVPGIFYSAKRSMPDDPEYCFILGEQEDAPYELFNPVKLYSVAELGMMLPKSIHGQGVFISARCFSDNGEWQATYHSFFPDAKNDRKISVTAPTEAQARAELLILLIKIKVANVNQINDLFAWQVVPQEKSGNEIHDAMNQYKDLDFNS